MREIKFRAWDKDMKMMVYDDELTGHIEYDTNPLNTINIILNEDDYRLDFMQYTGLKDANDKEIYEGDICKSDEGNIKEVIWQDNSWMYKLRVVKSYQGESYVETIYDTMRSTNDKRFGDEVMGNIYENPELLKDK